MKVTYDMKVVSDKLKGKSIKNAAVVSSDNMNPGNDTEIVEVPSDKPVTGGLNLTKTVDHSQINVGDTVKYTLIGKTTSADTAVNVVMDDAAAAVSEVLKAIPRSGAYSNYEIPFRTFYNSNMSKVTGDSYVYIIGDARNNKNRSGEEYVKAIARKAKKAFWLNTEEMSDWNTGDSIIGTYAKYMTKVAQTTTAAELLGFLER